MQKIVPFFWFNTEAKEAAEFYVSVFGKDSKIIETGDMEDTPSGHVDVVSIELRGQKFTLMSAGPTFKFNEAISFVIDCDDQAEVDYFWEKLSADPSAEQCGWLKDKFGVSWQVVPRGMIEMVSNKDKAKAARAAEAMMKMKKLDIAVVEAAFNG